MNLSSRHVNLEFEFESVMIFRDFGTFSFFRFVA